MFEKYFLNKNTVVKFTKCRCQFDVNSIPFIQFFIEQIRWVHTRIHWFWVFMFLNNHFSFINYHLIISLSDTFAFFIVRRKPKCNYWIDFFLAIFVPLFLTSKELCGHVYIVKVATTRDLHFKYRFKFTYVDHSQFFSSFS